MKMVLPANTPYIRPHNTTQMQPIKGHLITKTQACTETTIGKLKHNFVSTNNHEDTRAHQLGDHKCSKRKHCACLKKNERRVNEIELHAETHAHLTITDQQLSTSKDNTTRLEQQQALAVAA